MWVTHATGEVHASAWLRLLWFKSFMESLFEEFFYERWSICHIRSFHILILCCNGPLDVTNWLIAVKHFSNSAHVEFCYLCRGAHDTELIHFICCIDFFAKRWWRNCTLFTSPASDDADGGVAAGAAMVQQRRCRRRFRQRGVRHRVGSGVVHVSRSVEVCLGRTGSEVLESDGGAIGT